MYSTSPPLLWWEFCTAVQHSFFFFSRSFAHFLHTLCLHFAIFGVCYGVVGVMHVFYVYLLPRTTTFTQCSGCPGGGFDTVILQCTGTCCSGDALALIFTVAVAGILHVFNSVLGAVVRVWCGVGTYLLPWFGAIFTVC